MEPQDVIYQSHPIVTLGGNKFLCPTVIQWESYPLMEVGQFETAGYTTKFAIYHSDGTQIATVKGAQVYLTKDGQKAAITMRHEPNLTACEMEGKTLFELRREGAAALKGAAELYAPEGVFITCNDTKTAALLNTENGGLNLGGRATMSGCMISAPIGILFTRQGVGIGAGGCTITPATPGQTAHIRAT